MSEEVTLDEFAKRDESDEQKQKWKKVKLHEIAYKRTDNVDPQEIDLGQHIGLEHIEPNNPVPNWESLDDLSSTKRRFEAGDILFAKLRPNLEKSAQPDFDGVASTDIFPIVAEGNINSKWLLYRLSSKPAYDYARRTSAGTRMPRTSWNLFSNFDFALPPLPEQHKIATVLYTIDQAIEKSEEIEAQFERTQKGLIQDFLENGLNDRDTVQTNSRLGEIPEHWEVVTINDILSDEEYAFTDGARYELSSAEIHSEGDARAILLKEVGVGEFDDSKPKFATQEKYDNLTHRAIYPGEVVIAKMADPVARACIVPDTYDQYLLGCADVVRVKTNHEFEDHFLNYCMNSHKLWSQAVSHLRGTGRSRINLENIAELQLPKPPLSEQKEIVEKLHNFDNRIQNESRYRNRLQRLKQGLMQDLLSGTVRTTDTNINVPDEVAQYG